MKKNNFERCDSWEIFRQILKKFVKCLILSYGLVVWVVDLYQELRSCQLPIKAKCHLYKMLRMQYC